MKNPRKVLLPGYDFVLIALGAEKSGDRIPFALLDDLPLDLCHGSAIETSVSGSLGVYIVFFWLT